jgi:hypothetical protein
MKEFLDNQSALEQMHSNAVLLTSMDNKLTWLLVGIFIFAGIFSGVTTAMLINWGRMPDRGK